MLRCESAEAIQANEDFEAFQWFDYRQGWLTAWVSITFTRITRLKVRFNCNCLLGVRRLDAALASIKCDR